jgi:hypothetical protein
MGRKEKNDQLLIPGIGGFEEIVRGNGANRDRRNKRSAKKVLKRSASRDGLISSLEDVQKMPHLSLKKVKKLPNVSAVYYVVANCSKIIYVGMTQSLTLRFISHNKMRDFKRYAKVNTHWIECDANLLRQFESEMIQQFEPVFNSAKLASTEYTVRLDVRISERQEKILKRYKKLVSKKESDIVRELIEGLERKIRRIEKDRNSAA